VERFVLAQLYVHLYTYIPKRKVGQQLRGRGLRDESIEADLAQGSAFAGTAKPKSFITICKSFQVSFFWRGSRSRNAGW
jgi:hypothetical protein